MHKTIIGDVEITSDGMTVWVNGPKGCMARYGRVGYEIGPLPYVYGVIGGGLLTINRARQEVAWDSFTSALLQRHGITIPDSHKPKFLAAAEVQS